MLLLLLFTGCCTVLRRNSGDAVAAGAPTEGFDVDELQSHVLDGILNVVG